MTLPPDIMVYLFPTSNSRCIWTLNQKHIEHAEVQSITQRRIKLGLSPLALPRISAARLVLHHFLGSTDPFLALPPLNQETWRCLAVKPICPNLRFLPNKSAHRTVSVLPVSLVDAPLEHSPALFRGLHLSQQLAGFVFLVCGGSNQRPNIPLKTPNNS